MCVWDPLLPEGPMCSLQVDAQYIFQKKNSGEKKKLKKVWFVYDPSTFYDTG